MAPYHLVGDLISIPDEAGTSADVVALRDGGYVVTWVSSDAGGEVRFQRLDAHGRPLGPVLSTDDGSAVSDGYQVRAVALADGGFAIVWHEFDAGADHLFTQHFDASGVATTAAIPVVDGGIYPGTEVAVLDGGDYVVTWTASIAGERIVQGVVVDADGTVGSLLTLIDTAAVAGDTAYDVVALANGGFAVSHLADGAVTISRFDASGTPDGAALDLGVTGALPSVTELANGNLAVSWFGGTDGTAFNYAIVKADGSLDGGVQQFADAITAVPFQLLALPDGGFLVAGVSDGSNQVTVAQFGPSGAFIGTAALRLPGGAVESEARFALSDDGDVLVTWESSDGSLHVQRLTGNAASTVTEIDDTVALEDTPFSLSVADAFVDDEGDAMTFTATLADGSPLPAWLAFDAATATFSGTPEGDDAGALDVLITVVDARGNTTTDDFTITVTPVNDAPVVATPIGTQLAQHQQPFSFTVPTGTFSDVDDATLTLSATLSDGSPLPAWLSFDAATGTLSGTPPAGLVWVLLRITATDSGGLTASSPFTLSVSSPPANIHPVVAVPIADQAVTEGEAFTFRVPANTFTDADGDPLTLSAFLGDRSPLPAWLTFDAASGTFSGTPPEGVAGTLDILVFANDASAKAGDTFTLTIADGGDPTDPGDPGDPTDPGDPGDPTDPTDPTEPTTGTDGDDTLTGREGPDVLFGRDGDDRIDAGASDDLVQAGAGDDTVFGREGRDSLSGGGGDDVIDAGASADSVGGGGGDDVIRGQGGGDVLDGGGGADAIGGGAGRDEIAGGDGGDRVVGGRGRDLIDGGGVDDHLDGGRGHDMVEGGDGDDRLAGGRGRDRLEGGEGEDVFAFHDVEDVGYDHRDIILDFGPGDRISLVGLDADATRDGNQAFRFVDLAEFGTPGQAGTLTAAIGEDHTFVRGDVDGDGRADFSIALKGQHALTAGDFLL